jgi:hypothetical protein
MTVNRDKIEDRWSDNLFTTKVNTIMEENPIKPIVNNKTSKSIMASSNFVLEEDVNECMLPLKPITCEGLYRMPLLLLRDGVEILHQCLARWFRKYTCNRKFLTSVKLPRLYPITKRQWVEN